MTRRLKMTIDEYTICTRLFFIENIGIIVCCALAVIISSNVVHADINSGMVAYWSFDNCDANDDTKKGHNGIMINYPSCHEYEVGGKNGLCFNCGLMNSWIKVPNKSDLSFQPNGKFTICALVYPFNHFIEWCNENGDYCTPYGAIVVKCPSNTVWDYGLYYERDSRKFMVGRHLEHLMTYPNVEEDKWYHLSVVYNNCSWKLYVNAVLVDERDGHCISRSNGALGIGRKGESSSYADFYQGMIDEVRIYHRALSGNEIKKVYRYSLNRPPTKPVLKSPLNGAANILPKNIQFRWKPSKDVENDPIKYCVDVEDSKHQIIFAGCKQKLFSSKCSYSLPVDLRSGKQYLWSVLAVDSKGDASERSESWSFTTK